MALISVHSTNEVLRAGDPAVNTKDKHLVLLVEFSRVSILLDEEVR